MDVEDVARIEGILPALQEPSDSDGLYLQQVWSWIFPVWRRSASNEALIAFSQALAANLQLPLIGGVVSLDGKLPTMRFARRSGCRPIATLYLYDAVGAV